MDKKIRMVICIASTVTAIAAAVYFAVKYRAKLDAFFARFAKKNEKEAFTDEEYRDFADI